MTEELKQIKKIYGEKMSHFCREMFPTILEQEGLLTTILKEKYQEDKDLYENIVIQGKQEDFKNYIYSFLKADDDTYIVTSKKPAELLSEVGYHLYECKSEEDIQYFKKYYAKGEELCTFRGGRLRKSHVFFAVKKDVDNIKREDYSNPKRQDLYGTSVISIQFSKGDTNRLSIKNRYNHVVNNPDATFSNNLDLINKGLTKSFAEEYQLNVIFNASNFELEGYVLANDGKYYKYNSERNNIYYCPNNIIIDNFEVKKYDPSRYLVIDCFILDIKDKKITPYVDSEDEDFVGSLEDIEKIEVTKIEQGKKINIYFKNNNKEIVTIEIDKSNNMIRLNDPNLITIGDRFLSHNQTLREFTAPRLTVIGNRFLSQNKDLTKFIAPNLKNVGDYFLAFNRDLEEFKADELIIVGSHFLFRNEALTRFECSKLTNIGDFCMFHNKILKEFITPNLINIGSCFLYNNLELMKFIANKLATTGKKFLFHKQLLDSATWEFDNVKKTGISK